jgi:ComF family protein
LKVKKYLQKLEFFILDILLPKKCINCNKEGSFLCLNCYKKIQLNSWQTCPVCKKFLTEYGEICRYCKPAKPSIDSLTVATDYQDPLISKTIHLLKYKFVIELADPLAKILIQAYQKNKLPLPDIIIPIPLHPLRLRGRGFNQSYLLASFVASNLLPNLKIEVNEKVLRRTKLTHTQANLKNAQQRQENIKRAFSANLSSIDKIKNKRILLIDDISTTGSTLMEAANEIRKLKPKAIHCLVIASQK